MDKRVVLMELSKLFRNDHRLEPSQNIIYATVLNSSSGAEGKYLGDVCFDGAPDGRTTPVISSVKMEPGDRVTVVLSGRQALVTGNITAPSVGLGTVSDEVSQATGDIRNDLEDIKVNVRVERDGLYLGKAGSAIEMRQDNDEIVFQKPGYEQNGQTIPPIVKGSISDQGVSFDHVYAVSEMSVGKLVARQDANKGIIFSWEDDR